MKEVAVRLETLLLKESLDVRSLVEKSNLREDTVLNCLRAMLDSGKVKLNELNKYTIGK